MHKKKKKNYNFWFLFLKTFHIFTGDVILLNQVKFLASVGNMKHLSEEILKIEKFGTCFFNTCLGDIHFLKQGLRISSF